MTDTEYRTVATFDEWKAWAAEEKQTSPICPRAIVVGELAEQIRNRFGVDSEAPVRVMEAFDMTRMGVVMGVDCDYITFENFRDTYFDRAHRAGYNWAEIKAWLDGAA